MRRDHPLFSDKCGVRFQHWSIPGTQKYKVVWRVSARAVRYPHDLCLARPHGLAVGLAEANFVPSSVRLAPLAHLTGRRSTPAEGHGCGGTRRKDQMREENDAYERRSPGGGGSCCGR